MPRDRTVDGEPRALLSCGSGVPGTTGGFTSTAAEAPPRRTRTPTEEGGRCRAAAATGTAQHRVDAVCGQVCFNEISVGARKKCTGVATTQGQTERDQKTAGDKLKNYYTIVMRSCSSSRKLTPPLFPLMTSPMSWILKSWTLVPSRSRPVRVSQWKSST